MKASYLLNGLKFQCCLPAEVPLLVGMEWLQVPAARLVHHHAALTAMHAHSTSFCSPIWVLHCATFHLSYESLNHTKAEGVRLAWQ